MNRYRFDEKNHLHSLDGKPLIGTSTVGSVIAKPLTWWAAGKALEPLGWSHPKQTPVFERSIIAAKGLAEVKEMNPDDFLELLDKCYRAHDTAKNKAADTGTDMHAELEKYVKYCVATNEGKPFSFMVPENEHPALIHFSKWAVENVTRFLWSELHCYSEKLWVGGITDCGAELKNGSIAIIDFKSSKEAYASQFWQIGGYDLELTENGGFDADGNKTFELPTEMCSRCAGTGQNRRFGNLEEGCEACNNTGRIQLGIDCHIVFPFGMVDPKPDVRYDVESDREAFAAEVLLYKKLNQINNS